MAQTLAPFIGAKRPEATDPLSHTPNHLLLNAPKDTVKHLLSKIEICCFFLMNFFKRIEKIGNRSSWKVHPVTQRVMTDMKENQQKMRVISPQLSTVKLSTNSVGTFVFFPLLTELETPSSMSSSKITCQPIQSACQHDPLSWVKEWNGGRGDTLATVRD